MSRLPIVGMIVLDHKLTSRLRDTTRPVRCLQHSRFIEEREEVDGRLREPGYTTSPTAFCHQGEFLVLHIWATQNEVEYFT